MKIPVKTFCTFGKILLFCAVQNRSAGGTKNNILLLRLENYSIHLLKWTIFNDERFPEDIYKVIFQLYTEMD